MEKKKTGLFSKKETGMAEKTRLIGIAGVGNGVGATHLSVMMLNYLTGFRRRNAALLEWNQTGDLVEMERVCTGRCSRMKPYRVLDADYYKEAAAKELAEALGRNYEDILIDFGDVRDREWSEFLRCEKQFLVGSFSEWQQEEFWEFEMQKAKIGKKSWISLAAFGSEEARKEWWRRFRLKAERIPFSADAFVVTSELRDFFDRFL